MDRPEDKAAAASTVAEKAGPIDFGSTSDSDSHSYEECLGGCFHMAGPNASLSDVALVASFAHGLAVAGICLAA